jgi:hypothetical protein
MFRIATPVVIEGRAVLATGGYFDLWNTMMVVRDHLNWAKKLKKKVFFEFFAELVEARHRWIKKPAYPCKTFRRRPFPILVPLQPEPPLRRLNPPPPGTYTMNNGKLLIPGAVDEYDHMVKEIIAFRKAVDGLVDEAPVMGTNPRSWFMYDAAFFNALFREFSLNETGHDDDAELVPID